MKKKWLIILSFCVMAAFILQILFYWIFMKKYVGDNKSISEIENFRYSVKEFLKICAKHEATIIPAERDKLLGFQQFGAQYLHYFVETQQANVLSFITFNEVFENKVVISLIQNGFYHSFISQPDAKLLSQNIVIDQVHHHVFMRNKFAIHVIVSYHRDGNFWWHGSFKIDLFSPSIKSLFPLDNFHINQNEEAFDEFPVIPLRKDELTIYVPRNISNFLHQLNHSSFIECNHTRSKLFYSQYKIDTSEDAMTFRALAWKLLRMTKTVLDKMGIRFWLSSGTCLGYFRQCDIIPYSKDVDIGIWIKDYHPLILTSLLATGMNLKHKLGKVEDSLELSFMFEGIKLDIFFFYEEDDHVWNGGLQTKTGKKFKYIFPKFDLCWTEFLGLKLSIPCQTESYIIANYGRSWHKPIEKWDWKTSPFNVQPNGVWSEEEWNDVIQVAEFQF